MLITLPFTTPITNVLRFLLIEYVILKLFNNVIAGLTKQLPRHPYPTEFQEHWPGIFLVPYRLRHPTLLGKLIPITMALLINAFLLSTEFAFSSVTTQNQSLVTSRQQISTPELEQSVYLDGMKWISRVAAISRQCVTRNNAGNEIDAVEGFVRDEFLDNPSANFEAGGLDIICFDDPRVKVERVNGVKLNISHSGMDVEKPFRDADAVLTVLTVKENLFDFESGDVDITVQGKLTLSQPGSETPSYNVTGSCTGFSNDFLLYCYLTDGADYRFILPSFISTLSDMIPISNISIDNVLRLSNFAAVFRAHVLPLNGFHARDGDHLAAIKSLVTTFSPRVDKELNPELARLYYPVVTRSFYIGTVLGATSLRIAPVEMKVKTGGITERAQVTRWALVMICMFVGLLFSLSSLAWVYERKTQKYNIPATYNDLVEMIIHECLGDRDFEKAWKKKVLTCTLWNDGDIIRCRPVDAGWSFGEDIWRRPRKRRRRERVHVALGAGQAMRKGKDCLPRMVV